MSGFGVDLLESTSGPRGAVLVLVASISAAQPALPDPAAQPKFVNDVLDGVQEGALVWDECKAPITENPGLDDVEIWEVYNATGDAHPFHVHLVSFQILDRQKFKADMLPKDVIQHDGSVGLGFTLQNIKKIGRMHPITGYEAGWKDTALMMPGEVTRIMARFDRPGRYVYHCHILSHEDHEMMRAYHVGPWDPALDMPYACHDHANKSLPEADLALGLRLSPNPFNPQTRISFRLPEASHVHLLVYDIRGALVNVLLEGDQPGGDRLTRRPRWTTMRRPE